MTVKEMVEVQRRKVLREVLVFLGYTGDDVDAKPVEKLLSAVLEAPKVPSSGAVIAFPYLKLRNRVLTREVCIYAFAKAMNFDEVEDFDKLNLVSFPGFDGAKSTMLWNMTREDLRLPVRTLARMNVLRPEVQLKGLEISRLAGVVLKENTAACAAGVLGRYLLENGDMRENTEKFEILGEAADKRLRENGIFPDPSLSKAYHALYNGWARYKAVAGWKRGVTLSCLVDWMRD